MVLDCLQFEQARRALGWGSELKTFMLSNQITSTLFPFVTEFCHLPSDPGPCKGNIYAFYYSPSSNSCQEFIYGGCQGNANRFKTNDECHYNCVEKPGVCPQDPQQQQQQQQQLPCLEKCQHDWNCPEEQKCCRYGCLSECKDIVYMIHGRSHTLSPVHFALTKGEVVWVLLGLDVVWAHAGFSGVFQALLRSIKGRTGAQKESATMLKQNLVW
uniref:BPTI/Kunitz inhibitor domain-containing protein n=1 Tax=Laticauda laticaudata TaxID=8630 RepID=A0A8C5SMD6_LATLA